MAQENRPQAALDLGGLGIGSALANGSIRLTRERMATETLDAYGRPTRRLAERLVVESVLPRSGIVVAPSAFRSLPQRRHAISDSASKLLSQCYGCLLSLMAIAMAMLALPLAMVAGYVWSGRTAGGGLIGFGVWALALAMLTLGPRS